MHSIKRVKIHVLVLNDRNYPFTLCTCCYVPSFQFTFQVFLLWLLFSYCIIIFKGKYLICKVRGYQINGVPYLYHYAKKSSTAIHVFRKTYQKSKSKHMYLFNMGKLVSKTIKLGIFKPVGRIIWKKGSLYAILCKMTKFNGFFFRIEYQKYIKFEAVGTFLAYVLLICKTKIFLFDKSSRQGYFRNSRSPAIFPISKTEFFLRKTAFK